MLPDWDRDYCIMLIFLFLLVVAAFFGSAYLTIKLAEM